MNGAIATIDCCSRQLCGSNWHGIIADSIDCYCWCCYYKMMLVIESMQSSVDAMIAEKLIGTFVVLVVVIVAIIRFAIVV